MHSLQDLNIQGKIVFVRVDFNVPLDASGGVTDDTRIRAALPTLRYLLQEGASVVLGSHLGRPKGKAAPEFSLKQIVPAIEGLLGQAVVFAGDVLSAACHEALGQLKAGEVALLENLRFHAEEEQGDEAFARQLAALADVYVNDAFGTAHRAHASTTVMAQFFEQKAPGLLMQAELDAVAQILKTEGGLTAIVGGAKVSSKIGILAHLIERADCFIIGGGMVYTFVRAMGGNTGNSLVEEDMVPVARDFLDRCKAKGRRVLIPEDSMCSSVFGEEGEKGVYPTMDIPEGFMGLDAGPKGIEALSAAVKEARIILWNGPLGVFEMPSFAQGTLAIGRAIADATETGAYSLVGGGDSVAAANQLGIADRLSYVSTGGGALLECMEGKVLPGVAALEA